MGDDLQRAQQHLQDKMTGIMESMEKEWLRPLEVRPGGMMFLIGMSVWQVSVGSPDSSHVWDYYELIFTGTM